MGISLEDFKDLCNSLYNQRQIIDDQKDILQREQEKFEKIKMSVLQYLEENNLDRFVTDDVTISKTEKLNVSMKDKKEFFDYLKSRGIFEDLVTVNYNTLNSFYKLELEQAIKTGDLSFKIPGLEESSMFKNISIRKRG